MSTFLLGALILIHVLFCLFLIGVVLLQQGKGADLSVFGGGATQTAFGARGAVTVLQRMTAWGFVLFIVTTLTIGVYQSKRSKSEAIENLPVAAPAITTEPTPAAPAVDTPTNPPPVDSSTPSAPAGN